MKINSHVIGLVVIGGLLAGWLILAEKQIERIGEYTIYKKGGKFVAERLPGERKTNPQFVTIEEVRAWVAQQQILDKGKAAAYSLPWGHS